MLGSRKERKDWSMAIYARLKPVDSLRRPTMQYKVSEIRVKQEGLQRSVLEFEVPPDVDPSYIHNYPAGKINFEFDKVFDQDVQQDDIFDWTTEEKVSDIFEGINSTIFAYGQTGSGKTYTMFGGETFEDRGLIPRTITILFQQMKKRKSFSFTCHISFLEIYKEVAYDLLDIHKNQRPVEEWTPITILENEEGILLKNLNVYEVVTEEEALNLFFLGFSNR